MEIYEPLKAIGEGAFGKVYLMRHKQERVLYCVKVIKLKNIPKKERDACRMEVQLLKKMKHPNIVGYKDSFFNNKNDSLCIVMQYADGGDLSGQIKIAAKTHKLYSESKILHWFVQMALGLHYMHQNRVLHRDLKTQNIFLLGNGRLVLGDLGISKVLEGTMDFAQTCIGTPYYMSPEIFKNKPYNHKSDIWALGCVLYEMTTLNHAFDANSINGLACKIVKGRYPPIHTRYSKSLRDLIGAMLSTAPSSRPQLEDILRKAFVKRHIRDFLSDILSRPVEGLGHGTMAVRAAALCVVTDPQGGAPSVAGGGADARAAHKVLGANPEVASLRAQLDALDLQDVITAAFEPAVKEAQQLDAQQAAKLGREQASALRREEDRRKAVEQALAKLKDEREQRLRDREKLRAEARDRAARRGGGAAAARRPGGDARPWGATPSEARAAVRPAQPRASKPHAGSEVRKAVADRVKRPGAEPERYDAVRGAPAPIYAAAARIADAPRRRLAGGQLASARDRTEAEAQRVADLEQWEDAQQRAQRAQRDRRSEPRDARGDARAPRDRRSDDGRDAPRDRRSDDGRDARRAAEDRARDEAQVEAAARARDADAARQRQRESERERQRQIIAKLREDKVALDGAERDRLRRRDERRREVERELERGAEAAYAAPAAAPARRRSPDVASRDDAAHADSAIDRARAAARDAGNSVANRAAAAEQWRHGLEGKESDAPVRRSPRPPRGAAEVVPYDGRDFEAGRKPEPSARERVLQRKQDAQDAADAERMAQLAEAHAEASHVRKDAQAKQVDQYRSSFDPPVVTAAEGQRSSRRPPSEERSRASPSEDRRPGAAEDSTRRLDAEARRSRRSAEAKAAESDEETDDGRGAGAVDVDDRTPYDFGAGTDDDLGDDDGDGDDGWAHPDPDHVEDAEADIEVREQELQQELEFATARCEELRKTLDATKTYIAKTATGKGGIILENDDDAPRRMRPRDDDGDAAGTWRSKFTEGDEDDDALNEEDEDDYSVDPTPKTSSRRNLRPAPVDARPRTPRQEPPELSDAVSPTGRLADRIQILKQRCLRALGEEPFRQAYAYLKSLQDADDDHGLEAGGEQYGGLHDAEEQAQLRLRVILGPDRVHFSSLIDQLIFMEESL
ncbi:hypothetical protein M885DRAFT_534558 [Pelagophyceae sp. CCMP2097]|nr:hypothetical protein M885DRAFT_534558 [Pelagophyceae sp. CCMP2097]